MVKRELRNLDAVQLKSIETERKQEIAQLAREREQLKMREDELLSQVAKLEERIQKREMAFKKQKDQVEDYYEKNLNQKKDAHKNEQMHLAQYRGQRAARLKAQREKLEHDKAQLLAEMKKKGLDVASHTMSPTNKGGQKLSAYASSSGADHNGILKGFESNDSLSEKEELEKMVEHVNKQIGAETARLKKLKHDYAEEAQQDDADQIELDSDLKQLASGKMHQRNANSSLSDKASAFVNEVEKDIQDMLKTEDPSTSNQTSQQRKRAHERRAKLSMKLQDTVVDELDKMVAETDTGMVAPQVKTNQEPSSAMQRRTFSPNVNDSTGKKHMSRTDNADNDQNSMRQEYKESANPEYGQRRKQRGAGSYADNYTANNRPRAKTTDDPILAEIERLKQDYARSGSQDPRMLAEIQALERDYAVKQSQFPPGAQGGQYYQQAQYNQQQPPFQNPYAPQQYQAPMMGMPSMGAPMVGNMGMVGGMNPVLMQQQMMMQQQQQQLALERQRMEREMEEMMREREEDRFGAQRVQMQQMMAGLTSAIAGAGTSNDNALQQQLQAMAGGSQMMGGTKTSSGKQIIDEDALRQLAMLSQGPLKDSELYKLHMQHLSELTKTRLEMDKLEQQQTLLQMQKDLKRRQEEHEKDAEHELFMAEKRRQLRAARIQRILAKEMPGGAEGPEKFSTSYDPVSGLLIWFDFALGIPTRFRKLQLVYCFAIDTQVQTKPKALPVSDCEPDNNTHQKAIFGGTRKVSQVSIAPKTRVVMEIQSISGGPAASNAQMESIGWTALDFFVPEDPSNSNSRLVLNAGLHRLPLQRGSINWKSLGDVKLPTVPHITMFMRIVSASENGRAKIMSIEPSVVQHNYRYPNAIKGVPKGMRSGGVGAKGVKNRRAEMLARKKARLAASEYILLCDLPQRVL